MPLPPADEPFNLAGSMVRTANSYSFAPKVIFAIAIFALSIFALGPKS
jgi:hypothetical protein